MLISIFKKNINFKNYYVHNLINFEVVNIFSISISGNIPFIRLTTKSFS